METGGVGFPAWQWGASQRDLYGRVCAKGDFCSNNAETPRVPLTPRPPLFGLLFQPWKFTVCDSHPTHGQKQITTAPSTTRAASAALQQTRAQ